MAVCDCNSTLGNTGLPGCLPIWETSKVLLLQSLIGSNGTANSFDLTAGEPDLASIQAALSASDSKDRIYPLKDFENVENVRAEDITEEFPSGKVIKIREGFKTFTGFIPGADPVLVGKIKEAQCSGIGAFILDISDNFVFSARQGEGVIETAYPIAIDNQTFSVVWKEATDTTSAGIMISFQWDATEKDEYLRQISQGDLDFGASNIEGLLDVSSAIANLAGGGSITFDLTLKTDYGTPVSGVAGDLTFFNLTAAAAITPNTVTEVGDTGVYQVDLPNQTLNDVIQIDGVTAGLDYAQTKANTFLAP